MNHVGHHSSVVASISVSEGTTGVGGIHLTHDEGEEPE